MHWSWSKNVGKYGGTVVRSFTQGEGEDFPWLNLQVAFPIIKKRFFGIMKKSSVGHYQPTTAEGVCAALTTHFFIQHSKGSDSEFFEWITKPSGISRIMNTQVYYDGGPEGLQMGSMGKAASMTSNALGARMGTRATLTKAGMKYLGGLPGTDKRKDFNPTDFVNAVANETVMGKADMVYKRIGIFGSWGGHAIGSVSTSAPKQFIFFDVNQGFVSFNRINGFKDWLKYMAMNYYNTSRFKVDRFYVDFYGADHESTGIADLFG